MAFYSTTNLTSLTVKNASLSASVKPISHQNSAVNAFDREASEGAWRLKERKELVFSHICVHWEATVLGTSNFIVWTRILWEGLYPRLQGRLNFTMTNMNSSLIHSQGLFGR